MNTKVETCVISALTPCRKSKLCKTYLTFAPFAPSPSQKNAGQNWKSLFDKEGKVKETVRFFKVNETEVPPR